MRKIYFNLLFLLFISIGLFLKVDIAVAADNISVVWNSPPGATTAAPSSVTAWKSLFDGKFATSSYTSQNWTITVTPPPGYVWLKLEYPGSEWLDVGSDWHDLYVYVLSSGNPMTLSGSMTFVGCGNPVEEIYAKVWSSSAPVINGQCGTADTYGTAVAPSGSSLCSEGIATTVAKSGNWTWTCIGSNGGSTASSCWAPISVNGVCGSVNGLCVNVKPSGTGVCSSGSVSGFSGGGETPYTWTCAGLYNGTNSHQCSAYPNGACGTANGVAAYYSGSGGYAQPSGTTLCSAGTASGVSDSLSCSGSTCWTWKCTGFNSCGNNSCSAPIKNDGICGDAARTYLQGEVWPDNYSYCTLGTPVPDPPSVLGVTGESTSTWKCKGDNGGKTSGSCVATRVINGICGSESGNNNCYSTILSGGLCSFGTSTAVEKESATTNGITTYSWNWTCDSTDGGANNSCNANRTVDGVCGTASGQAIGSAPTTNLCSAGTASTIIGGTSSKQWTWTCNGYCNGANPPCTAPVIGVCGSANEVPVTSVPATTSLCSAGTASTPGYVKGGGQVYHWTCTGNGVGIGSPAACKAPQLVMGACGSAAGVAVSSAPTTNLCWGIGVAVPIVSGSGSWTWPCAGYVGGESWQNYEASDPNVIDPLSNNADPSVFSPCTAPIGFSDGVCGSDSGVLTSSPNPSPSSLCSVGTPSGITTTTHNGSISWYWNCFSSTGGKTAACFAPMYGACGSASGIVSATAPPGPALTLCSSGTPTIIYSNSSSWYWDCISSDGTAGATCYAPISLSQTSPTVTFPSDAVTTDYCDTTPKIILKWSYDNSSDNNSPESKYEILISNKSDFSNNVVDETYSSSTSEYSANLELNSSNPECTTSASGTACDLDYGSTPYYWEVKVYDSQSTPANSSWVSGPSFTTTDRAWPYPVITVTTVYPLINQPVYLSANNTADPTKNSICYTATNQPTSCAQYIWDFDDPLSASNSDSHASTSHIYKNARGFNPQLTITDDDIPAHSCSISYSVNVSAALSLPQWKEISPF